MWKYLPVLNACLKILSTILVGAIMGKRSPGMFDKVFVEKSVQFVFHIALPCLIVKGIGVGVDFYSQKFVWEFISVFLALRLFALAFAILSLLFHRDRSQIGIGDMAVRWLSLSWISTVILGVPILTAVSGDAQKGLFYGLMAGISSFVFQLPFELFFLECHKMELEHVGDIGNSSPDSDEGAVVEATIAPNPNDATIDEVGITKNETEDTRRIDRWALWRKFATNTDLWKDILIRVGTNPVIWGILWGFLISLSTFGRRFLLPTSNDYLSWLQFFVDALSWFGDCVSPVSLFSMGIWMQAQGRNIFSIGYRQISLFMLSKLVLVPLITVGLAKAFQLDNETGRAAVLIATLPISMASFSLGNTYKIGEEILASNVAVGTLLMLPTVMIWNLVMDEIGLFTN